MTKVTILSITCLFVLTAFVAAGAISVKWISSGDYNSHVTNYRPECESVLKRYMPDERRQHMTYHEYSAMIDALKICNAHATPGLVKAWVWMPIPK
jgi:hypothetical protein